MSPFWTANIGFLCWPLVTAILFARLPAVRATTWTILGGFLFLPPEVAIKFAMIPQFDKASIPSICALIGCLASGIRIRLWTKFGIVEFLMAVYLLVPLATSWGNSDAFAFRDRFVPGVGWYDALSTVMSQSIELLPFILARQLVRTNNDIFEIFYAIVLGALVYSVPVLIELRMSPQFNNWLYGFQLSGFVNEVRYGGYRPVVFMSNGLMLSFFMMTGVVSAAVLWLHRTKIGQMSSGSVAAYFGLVLVLCKSAGALLYAIVLVPLVLFTKTRAQSRVAVALAVLALAYPLLKANNLFPDRTLLDIAAVVSVDRSQSLEVRFDQEESLLKHTSERFLLGWGRFGRNRVYDAYGKDVTITDGQWVITFSTFGLIGFLAQFGLLAVPVLRAGRALPLATGPSGKALLTALMLLVAASIIEQLPNASLTSWMWFLVGALEGRGAFLRGAAISSPVSSGGKLGVPMKSSRGVRQPVVPLRMGGDVD